jgi:uncharacterized protein (TIGR02246 family)
MAQDAAPTQEEQAVRAAANEYLAALAKGDARAIADLWTADGEFIDASGDAHSPGELAAEMKQAAAADPRPQSKITASKIRFLTPDVAVEDGASEVLWPGADTPLRGHFHATWVKKSGRWRLATLCEISDPAAAAPNLAELDWMVGTWTAVSGDANLESTVRWNETGKFLLRETKAVQAGKVLRSSQRIGWDPLSDALKSWSFDAEGGHAEGVWTKDGDSWVEQASGVLPDGRTASATAIITFDGKDRYVRKLVDARIDGAPIPDQEVRFTRQAAAPR